jgi:hypothetical protein
LRAVDCNRPNLVIICLAVVAVVVLTTTPSGIRPVGVHQGYQLAKSLVSTLP